MATHGHVTFYELSGGKRIRPIHCYTWHDGHKSEAINDLLHLPINIFKKQREASRKTSADPEDMSGVAEGYWVYNQMMEFALRSFFEKPSPYQRRQPWTRESVYGHWQSMIPLQTCSLSYATWFCQQRFNRWNVVPNLKWCSYPGPDIKVLCTDGRLNGYTLEIPFENDTEYADETFENINEHIKSLNSLLPDETIQIGNLPTINCHYRLARDGNTIRVAVPFDVIYCELFWKDVDEANKLIVEKKYDANPHLTKFVNRLKQVGLFDVGMEDAYINEAAG